MARRGSSRARRIPRRRNHNSTPQTRAHLAPQLLERGHDVVAVRLRLHSTRRCSCGDLLAVLVGPRHKPHGPAHHALRGMARGMQQGDASAMRQAPSTTPLSKRTHQMPPAQQGAPSCRAGPHAEHAAPSCMLEQVGIKRRGIECRSQVPRPPATPGYPPGTVQTRPWQWTCRRCPCGVLDAWMGQCEHVAGCKPKCRASPVALKTAGTPCTSTAAGASPIPSSPFPLHQ